MSSQSLFLINCIIIVNKFTYQTACPRGWAHIDGKCFLWLDEALSHEDAVSKCHELKTGSTLAMPKSREQLDLMRQLIEIDV